MYLPLMAYTSALSQQKQRTNEEKRIKKSVKLDGGSKVMEDLLSYVETTTCLKVFAPVFSL